MKNNTFQKGQLAEKNFKESFAFSFFGKDGVLARDETEEYREGEYRLNNGNLIEVKGDWKCCDHKKPTGNLPIEVFHSGHVNNYGWYQHCKMNGVTHLVFQCYRDEDKTRPCIAIKIPFVQLEALIDVHEVPYPLREIRDRGNIVRFYCVPMNDIIEKCDVQVNQSLHFPCLSDDWKGMLQKEGAHLMKVFGVEGVLGMPLLDVSIDNDD